MNPVPTDQTLEWYSALAKPWFAPPSYVFGLVWGILYPIIFLTFGYVFYKVLKGAWPKSIAVPFALNLIFNLLFSPIQFGLQNNLLAALDITLAVLTLFWAIFAVYKRSRLIAVLQVPYLVWGLFATILQFSITYLNW